SGHLLPLLLVLADLRNVDDGLEVKAFVEGRLAAHGLEINAKRVVAVLEPSVGWDLDRAGQPLRFLVERAVIHSDVGRAAVTGDLDRVKGTCATLGLSPPAA